MIQFTWIKPFLDLTRTILGQDVGAVAFALMFLGFFVHLGWTACGIFTSIIYGILCGIASFVKEKKVTPND